MPQYELYHEYTIFSAIKASEYVGIHFLGLAPPKKLYLWYRNMNPFVRAKITISHEVNMVQGCHTPFGLMGRHHQNLPHDDIL